MTTPPYGGNPQNDPYGQQNPQNQGGYDPQGQGGYDATNAYGQQGFDPQAAYGQQGYGQDASGQAWDGGQSAQGGYQPDPYQQQYDAYAQPQQSYQPETASWPSQQMGAYGSSPAGPAWGEEPKKSNKLPLIIGAALLVIGGIVALVIVLLNKDDDKGNNASGGSDKSTTQEQGGGTDESETSKESESSESSKSAGGGGGGSSALPKDLPVPDGVTIDKNATYCASDVCAATFTADDPEAAYEDWVKELEDAGYTITSKDIYGSGENAAWTIEADGPVPVTIYYASGGALTTG